MRLLVLFAVFTLYCACANAWEAAEHRAMGDEAFATWKSAGAGIGYDTVMNMYLPNGASI